MMRLPGSALTYDPSTTNPPCCSLIRTRQPVGDERFIIEERCVLMN
ncbi:MAG: hypothetical protein KAJ51_16355 [Thermoplasmata archaeon]|nr:hypothetical protein [Thermoplasmata archaeon]